MSGKEEQKHTVVSVNLISKSLQEKQKLSNEHDGLRTCAEKARIFLYSDIFPKVLRFILTSPHNGITGVNS